MPIDALFCIPASCEVLSCGGVGGEPDQVEISPSKGPSINQLSIALVQLIPCRLQSKKIYASLTEIPAPQLESPSNPSNEASNPGRTRCTRKSPMPRRYDTEPITTAALNPKVPSLEHNPPSRLSQAVQGSPKLYKPQRCRQKRRQTQRHRRVLSLTLKALNLDAATVDLPN